MNKIYLENLKVEPCFRSTKQNYVYCNSTPSQVKKPKLKWQCRFYNQQKCCEYHNTELKLSMWMLHLIYIYIYIYIYIFIYNVYSIYI